MILLLLKIFACLSPILVASLFCILFFKREFSLKLLILSIAVGCISIIPIVLVQFGIDIWNSSIKTTLISVFITALIFNGLVEESFKMLFLLILPSKNSSQKVFFGAAVLSGISLGCFEMVIYLLGGQQNFEIRFITSLLLHASCSGLSGLYVWSFKIKKLKIMPFILATGIHGVYNFFAGFTGAFWWLSIACLFFAFVQCGIYYERISKQESENVLIN